MTTLTPRNAPCTCGSGKRYKDCHGTLVSPPRDVQESRATLPGIPSALAGDAHDESTMFDRVSGRGAQSIHVLRERARDQWTRGDANAVITCRSAIEYAPDDVAAWNLLGEILRATDAAAAAEAWRHALGLDAKNAEASFHLGNQALERDDASSAISHFERALDGVPGHSGARNNLGLAFEAIGDHARAQACYRDVLTADARQPDALSNLADSLFKRESFHEVVDLYERLFSIRRELTAPAWVQRGMAHQRVGDLDAAQTCFRSAARIMPDDIRIQLNLGMVCSELKRFDDAERAWLRALDRDPRNAHALSMLAHGRQHRCAWTGLDALFADINALLEGDDGAAQFPANPFAVLAMPSSPRAQLRAAQRWAAQWAPSPNLVPFRALPARGGRLRVGFVSSDFRDHPMAHLSMEYWERLNRDRIETFAYGIRTGDAGPVGRRIERAFEHFADVSDASVADIVRRIRADRIDVLFDLNGYTTHSREAIFALRPAPVQVNCIGFPGTLGADWYDYVYVDPVSATEAMQPFFTERFLRMPHMSFPSDTTRARANGGASRAECGLPEDAFVFCCFNSAYKILPPVFAIWMRLLTAVPRSVLWLLDTSPEAKENLQREAARADIDPRRIIFAPKMTIDRHVARNAAADLFLDTFPYGAHTTANDALLAGLPVVTCAGDTLVSRIAASQLNAIGLPELVTPDLAAYESLALRLARDANELAALRVRLAANRGTHPLFDMARYARDFEDAVTRIWQDYRKNVA